MAFLPNIPQSTDQLSVSQGNILNNFGILGAIAGNSNNSSASINATSGFNWLYLATQGATPPASSGLTSGNVAMYSGLNATTSQNELYINKLNQATVTQIPATASNLSITSAPASNTGFFTYLPSGLILVGGNKTGLLTGLTLTTIASVPLTQLLCVLVSPYNGSTNADLNFAVRLVAITGANTFTSYFSSRTGSGPASGQTGFQWLAIGY
jgi:hypothetical protein